MGGVFEHKRHLIRMAGLFGLGGLAFVVLQLFMTPKSFGVYGHYRGDALQEISSRPPVFAGRAACAECHGDQADKLKTGPHARIGCEACHGALARHAEKPESVKPVKREVRDLCLTCHLKNAARPAKFPQVDGKEHGEGNPCNACHAPHSPKEMP